MLEALEHEKKCFLTLTFDDEHLPKDGSLRVEHYQKFLKDLRERLPPKAIRFFFVGEYGEESGRPHYHAILFGYPPCPFFNYKGCRLKYCETCRFIEKIWGKGFVSLGDVNKDSLSYVAGYVTKKMTHAEDKCTEKCTHPPLNGRFPEFARMSLKPGIGGNTIPKFLDMLATPAGCDNMVETQDVPGGLVHEKKTFPLGRYLRKKIKDRIGAGQRDLQGSRTRYVQSMRDLSRLLVSGESYGSNKSYGEMLTEKFKPKVISIEKRSKIFTKKGAI